MRVVAIQWEVRPADLASLQEQMRAQEQFTGADACAILEHDAGRGEFRIVAESGLTDCLGRPSMGAAGSRAGHALATCTPVVMQDATAERRFAR